MELHSLQLIIKGFSSLACIFSPLCMLYFVYPLYLWLYRIGISTCFFHISISIGVYWILTFKFCKPRNVSGIPLLLSLTGGLSVRKSIIRVVNVLSGVFVCSKPIEDVQSTASMAVRVLVPLRTSSLEFSFVANWSKMFNLVLMWP